jgi:hypothetical protein
MNYDRKKDMTKKAWKQEQKKHRVTNGFNTGTRDIASKKYPTRKQQKEIDRKEIGGVTKFSIKINDISYPRTLSP